MKKLFFIILFITAIGSISAMDSNQLDGEYIEALPRVRADDAQSLYHYFSAYLLCVKYNKPSEFIKDLYKKEFPFNNSEKISIDHPMPPTITKPSALLRGFFLQTIITSDGILEKIDAYYTSLKDRHPDQNTQELFNSIFCKTVIRPKEAPTFDINEPYQIRTLDF